MEAACSSHQYNLSVLNKVASAAPIAGKSLATLLFSALVSSPGFYDYLQNIVVPHQEGKEFDDGKEYTFETYKTMTENFSKSWFVPSDVNNTESPNQPTLCSIDFYWQV